MILNLKNKIKDGLAKRNKILIGEMIALGRDRKVKLEYLVQNDYIRTSTLELVSHEIYESSIDGETAELGVFKGDFAQYINQLFPDRKLYLFDTFTGFDKRDIKEDNCRGYNPENINFEVDSIQLVLNKMKYQDNCIIKKGYFPESSVGLEAEKYCFVSIDADLYKPIYDGLQYFFPRLNKGGYIFVHDYNQAWFKGAKGAVKQFCSENNIGYIPLTDSGGTAILTK